MHLGSCSQVFRLFSTNTFPFFGLMIQAAAEPRLSVLYSSTITTAVRPALTWVMIFCFKLKSTVRGCNMLLIYRAGWTEVPCVLLSSESHVHLSLWIIDLEIMLSLLVLTRCFIIASKCWYLQGSTWRWCHKTQDEQIREDVVLCVTFWETVLKNGKVIPEKLCCELHILYKGLFFCPWKPPSSARLSEKKKTIMEKRVGSWMLLPSPSGTASEGPTLTSWLICTSICLNSLLFQMKEGGYTGHFCNSWIESMDCERRDFVQQKHTENKTLHWNSS